MPLLESRIVPEPPHIVQLGLHCKWENGDSAMRFTSGFSPSCSVETTTSPSEFTEARPIMSLGMSGETMTSMPSSFIPPF